MNDRKPGKKGNANQRPMAEPPVEPSVPLRIPPGAPRLRKGDRVEFDIGQGVDGPPYAMNVRLILTDDEDE